MYAVRSIKLDQLKGVALTLATVRQRRGCAKAGGPQLADSVEKLPAEFLDARPTQ